MHDHPFRSCSWAAAAALGALLLLTAAPSFASEDAQAGPLDSGRSALARAVSLLFNDEISNAQARTLAEACAETFASLTDPALRSYWLARVDFFYGIVERADKRAKAAEQRFTGSLARLEKSVAFRESSDAYRLMADNYAQLMIVNGVLYAAITGWKVKNLCEKALSLDPGNAKALLTLSLYYMNAPGFAGGNVERATEMLNALKSRPDLDDEDRFAVRMWLGMAYGKKKDRAMELASYGEAQDVYPGNGWVRDMIEGKG